MKGDILSGESKLGKKILFLELGVVRVYNQPNYGKQDNERTRNGQV
jgi:hypothetical protein